MKYLVTWKIDIDAESPEEAVKEALEIQRDPSSIATIFEVTDEEGNTVLIDMEEVDICAICGNVQVSEDNEDIEGIGTVCSDCSKEFTPEKHELYKELIQIMKDSNHRPIHNHT